MDLINQPEVSKWIEQGRDKEHIYAVKNFLTGQGKVMVDRLISQANHMKKENIELPKEKCPYGNPDCPKCHPERYNTPKVELPEWKKELLELDDKTKINIYNFISQLLSHSTTQLVEKIMGEVIRKEKKYLEPKDFTSEEVNIKYEGFNQALQEVIKIISKYK